MSPPRDVLLIAAAVLAVAGLGAWVGIRLARRYRGWRAQRRFRQGRQGEEVAIRLLRRKGYTVIDTQVSAVASVEVDGQCREFEVRADAIVSKRRRKFVAEFKTGASASVANRATRRQLLEYAVTYRADGVLLVDATQATIVEIEFPNLR
ncbi:MAG: hypothetical protein JKY37_20740 [Nannocystaceae bacterium]|nr:hypothetical protein [Nannocystaceae bacterium]